MTEMNGDGQTTNLLHSICAKEENIRIKILWIKRRKVVCVIRKKLVMVRTKRRK